MSKIILTQGIQGSGKTTWAKQWVSEDPEHRIRINNDDITTMWGQPYGTKGLYEHLVDVRQFLVESAMSRDLDIVLDNMNLSQNSLKEIYKITEKFYKLFKKTYVIEYKDFTNVPLEVCIERDSKRPNPIGEKVITETYNRYINGK